MTGVDCIAACGDIQQALEAAPTPYRPLEGSVTGARDEPGNAPPPGACQAGGRRVPRTTLRARLRSSRIDMV